MLKNTTTKKRMAIISSVTVCLIAASVLVAWIASRKQSEPTVDGNIKASPIVNIEAVRTNAERGDAQAQKDLGRLYARGELVPQNYDEAAKWYRQSAEQGYAPAQAALGELYEAGRGVPHDDAEAAKWYRRAAESGDPSGQYSLAVLYVMGQGVRRDNAEALKWYRQAADRGLALAQYNLGMRYYEGTAVAPDPVEAYKWLSLAAAQGIPDADKARTTLKERMTSAQIDDAKRRVKAFAAKKTG